MAKIKPIPDPLGTRADPIKVKIGVMYLLKPGKTYVPMINGAPGGDGVEYTGDLPRFINEFGDESSPLVCRFAERESADVKYMTIDGNDAAVRVVERYLTLRD